MVQAYRFSIRFKLIKYKLIYFLTTTKQFNLLALVHLDSVTKALFKEIKVLGIYLDPKLKQAAYARHLKAKIATQIGALFKITASTQGLLLLWARIVYKAVVRPTVAYIAPIQYTPSNKPKGITKKLVFTQNYSLRIIASGYKAIRLSDIEVKVNVPPLDLYLNDRVLAYA